MKIEKINQFLNMKVKITFNNGYIETGILHREEDYPNDPNKLKDGGYLLRPHYERPYYDLHFRKSHIKEIEKLEEK